MMARFIVFIVGLTFVALGGFRSFLAISNAGP